MSTADSSVGGGGPRGGSPLVYLPVLWVGFVVLRALYALFGFAMYGGFHDLPTSVGIWIIAANAVAAVNVVWGGWVLWLGVDRSAAFPRNFVVWQVANLIWLALIQIYILAVPDFSFSPQALTYQLIVAAVGIACIVIVMRGPPLSAVSPGLPAPGARPSAATSVLAGIAGLVAGGAIGAFAGFGIGEIIAEVEHISCFEGGCGYFVVAIALLGIVIGAILGSVLAVVWVVRRHRRAVAAVKH